MRWHFRVAVLDRRAVVSAAALVFLAGCARQVLVSSASSSSAEFAPAASASSPADTAPTVEVRQYPYSPTLAVVGWAAEDTGLGLRTWVRREGTTSPEHRLWISTYYTASVRRFNQAKTSTGPLELLGIMKDYQACSGGHDVCSPYLTFGVRIPDAMLRANRDSMAVTLYAQDGAELAITLRRELIDAYLGVVDSVSASLKKKERTRAAGM